MPRQTQQPGVFADIRWGRFTFWLIAGMLLMVSTLFTWHRTEEFLINSSSTRTVSFSLMIGSAPYVTSSRKILDGAFIWSRSKNAAKSFWRLTGWRMRRFPRCGRTR